MPALIALALAAAFVASRRARSQFWPKAGDVWTFHFQATLSRAVPSPDLPFLLAGMRNALAAAPHVELVRFGVLQSPGAPLKLDFALVLRYRTDAPNAVTEGSLGVVVTPQASAELRLVHVQPGDHCNYCDQPGQAPASQPVAA